MCRRFVTTAGVLAILLTCLVGCSTTRDSTDRGAVAAGASARTSLDVVGLGDSVTAGTACNCSTFVQRYARLVAARTGARVRWTNDGVGGQTSGSLLADLRSGGTADDVSKADIVLITTGANDLNPALQSWTDDGCLTACMSAELPAMSRNITAIVARVRKLRDGRPVLIGVTDYWNVFEDGQVADSDYGRGFATWSDRITRLANQSICAAVAGTATCVDLYAPFNGSGDRDPTALLAADGDHPNAAGHAVIAAALAAAVMPTGSAPVTGG